MKQAIAGLAPPELGEATSMVVWPTIGATRAGRLVGQLSAIGSDSGRFFTAGKAMAVLCIPLALAVFVWNLLPFVMRRYRLTNKRVVVHRGYSGVEERAVGLDAFDGIDIIRLPGQEWLRSGEVAFQLAGQEVFRLSGVSRPEAFREVCLKARKAYVSVREVLQQQAAQPVQ
jgi:hypothetical protein